MKKTALLITLMFSSLAFTQSQVPAKFWGIQFNVDYPVTYHSSDYPVTGGPIFQTFRFWDTGTSWNQINTAVNTYDFTTFDNWMNNYVVPNSMDVIYTIAKTPHFFSSGNDYPPNYPPTDLLCHGNDVAGTGGSDATLIAFVKALWSHIQGNGWNTGRQWHFEVWNEPNNANGGFWDNMYISNTYCAINGAPDPTGPHRIIARMASDIRNAISPFSTNVNFLSPPVSSVGAQAAGNGSWWNDYMSGDGGQWGLNPSATCSGYVGTTNPCGGGQFADVISGHEYLGGVKYTDVSPDQICCGSGTTVNKVRTALTNYNQVSKPFFITEGSWGQYCNSNDGCVPNWSDVSWTGRYYTLLASQAEVALFAWYNYDTYGPFWCSPKYNMGPGCTQNNVLSPSGTALYQMQSVWGYDGGTFDANGCQTITPSTGSCGHKFRVCNLTEGTTRTSAQAVWYNTWNDSSDNSCGYVAPGTGWTDYRDLNGNCTPYSTGQSVQVTGSPVLFEKDAAGVCR